MALTITNFVQDQIDELNSTFGAMGIEYGSNANGYWCKLPGCVMIQWGNKTISSFPQSLTFPVSFINTSWSLSAIYQNTSVMMGVPSGRSVSGCNVGAVNHGGATVASGSFDWIAIGQWQ